MKKQAAASLHVSAYYITVISLSAVLLTLSAAPARSQSEQESTFGSMAFQTDAPPEAGWHYTDRLARARAEHTATLLRNGMVLAAGGTTIFSGALNIAELYDPATKTWTLT